MRSGSSSGSRPSGSRSSSAGSKQRAGSSSSSSSYDSEEDLVTTTSSANKMRSSVIQSVILEARSLVEVEQPQRPTIARPTRPFTPRDTDRRLFIENEYVSRPTSAYHIASSNFEVKLSPVSSSDNLSDAGSTTRKKVSFS